MRLACDRGTVFVEFLIAFPVIFILFLGVIQLALIGAASLVVRHAAYRAAREASLVLDEDPEHVDGAPRMLLTVAGETPGGGRTVAEHGARMQRVADAAHGALEALAPPATVAAAWATGTTPSLSEGALNPSILRAGVALLYTAKATTVDVGRTPGGGTRVFAAGLGAKVKVRYQYVCTVPIVNALMCASILDVPGSDALQDALGFDLPRLMELQASVEAPIHHANYLYRSEHDNG